MNPSASKALLAVCAVLVALLTGVNLVRLVERVPPPARGPTRGVPDSVLRHERRLAGVRAALERHAVRGAIGYVCGLTPEQLPTDPAAMRDYFLSQFVLAPWALEAKFSDCTWAVANFPDSAGERLPKSFQVVQDFGRGVLLLRKAAP